MGWASVPQLTVHADKALPDLRVKWPTTALTDSVAPLTFALAFTFALLLPRLATSFTNSLLVLVVSEGAASSVLAFSSFNPVPAIPITTGTAVTAVAIISTLRAWRF